MADDAGSVLPTQLAALFTVGAGAVHLAAAVPHFADSALLGTGFVVIGWSQLVAAALLLRRCEDRNGRWSVVTLNAVAIVAWALSRTVGLPVGHPGPEAVGVADALTVALEVVAVGLVAWRSRRGVERRSRWVRAAVLASAWTFVIGGSTLAIADVGTHGHVVVETAHDDVAPRSSPGTGLVGSSNDLDPDHTDTTHNADTADHVPAHTHAPGEGH